MSCHILVVDRSEFIFNYIAQCHSTVGTGEELGERDEPETRSTAQNKSI